MPENLILLCASHHKQVDDQTNTYTVECLTEIKAKHELWVESKLAATDRSDAPRIRREKSGAYELHKVKSGRDLFAVVSGACAASFGNDEPASADEVELFAAFFQELQDWGDLSADLEAADRVRAEFRLKEMVDEMETHGFAVYAGRETQVLEGGGDSDAWPVAIIRLTRGE